MNLLILQYTCVFLLTSVLKGMHESDSTHKSNKVAPHWIQVKVTNLTKRINVIDDILLLYNYGI